MDPSVSRRAVMGAGAAVAAGALLGSTSAEAGAVEGANAAEDLSFPSTRIARKARQLVTEAQQPYLRNHSLRSFLFGRAAAARSGLLPGRDYDGELLFLICVLHDMGLTDRANGDQRFEIDGADFAARFLEENGITDSRVDAVWDGVALHTSHEFSESPVFRRRRRPEIGIASEGIGFDLLGSPDQLPPGYADRVHAAYPRFGGARALTEAILAQALTNPRKAPPMTLPGELLHQRHPELPYLTWDDFLDRGGWGD